VAVFKLIRAAHDMENYKGSISIVYLSKALGHTVPVTEILNRVLCARKTVYRLFDSTVHGESFLNCTLYTIFFSIKSHFRIRVRNARMVNQSGVIVLGHMGWHNGFLDHSDSLLVLIY